MVSVGSHKAEFNKFLQRPYRVQHHRGFSNKEVPITETECKSCIPTEEKKIADIFSVNDFEWYKVDESGLICIKWIRKWFLSANYGFVWIDEARCAA